MKPEGLCSRILLSPPADWLGDIKAADLLSIGAPGQIRWTQEEIRFQIQWLPDKDELWPSLREEAAGDRRFCILVSDGLTETDSGGSLRPSQFTRDVRQLFSGKSCYCGLIGLTPGAPSRASDVDFLLPSQGLETAELRARIIEVTHRLWYKAPPARHPQAATGAGQAAAIRITSDLTFEQFRQCLALRHEVYRVLGYLDEQVRHSELQIEMDFFDSQALHFAALDEEQGRVLGTARLILPGRLENADPSSQAPFEAYCERLAREDNTLLFWRRLHEGVPSAMPIFDSFPFPQKYKSKLRPFHQYCELSRVIVAPDSRGLGIARLLVEAAIAAAVRLRRRVILLECAPHHRGLYERFDFAAVIEENAVFYSRARDLDQMAIAMSRDLTLPASRRKAAGSAAQPAPIRPWQVDAAGRFHNVSPNST